MKYKIHPILFLILIATQIFSQSDQLQISVNSNGENESSFEFALACNMNFNPTDGLKIETPQKVYLIPKSLQVNGKSMWLQNLATIPEQDSVIAWQSSSDGIVLLFRNDLIKDGDQLNISCDGSIQLSEQEQSAIQIKDVGWQSGELEVSEQIYIRGTIPAVPSR